MFLPLTFIKTPMIEAPHAKRCLFGTPDHEALNANLSARFDEQLRSASQKWNFDFKSEMPIPGEDYEWQRQVRTPSSPNQSTTPDVKEKRTPKALSSRVAKKKVKRVVPEQRSNQTHINGISLLFPCSSPNDYVFL